MAVLRSAARIGGRELRRTTAPWPCLAGRRIGSSMGSISAACASGHRCAGGDRRRPGGLIRGRAEGAPRQRDRSAGYAATIGLSLMSAPLLIRHLGIAAFGRYTTVVSIVTIVNGLTDAGLVNITLREWTTRSGDDRRSVMRSLLGLRLELSASGVLARRRVRSACGLSRYWCSGRCSPASGWCSRRSPTS